MIKLVLFFMGITSVILSGFPAGAMEKKDSPFTGNPPRGITKKIGTPLPTPPQNSSPARHLPSSVKQQTSMQPPKLAPVSFSTSSSPQVGKGGNPPSRLAERRKALEQQDTSGEKEQLRTPPTHSSQSALIIPAAKIKELLMGADMTGDAIPLDEKRLINLKKVDPTALQRIVTKAYCDKFEEYVKASKRDPRNTDRYLEELVSFYENSTNFPSGISVNPAITAVSAKTVISNYEAATVNKVKKKKPGKAVRGQVDHFALLINDTVIQYPIKSGVGESNWKLIYPTIPISITTVDN